MIQDKIIIEDLECFGFHGVLKEEQTLGQKFLVSLVMYVDTRQAGKCDDLDQSVNYARVCELVTSFMKENTFQLIEAAAEHLAEKILLTYSKIEKIEVTIKKPWAPVRLPLDTVGVTITRGWHRAYIGIGANLGNKEKNIENAIECFREHPLCRIKEVSRMVKTKPFGVKEQEDFLNGTFLVETLLDPEELLELIGEIETKLKRVRKQHWGPRTIDLDILFYDSELIHTKQLTVPHPGIPKRDFVLVPLCDINPYHVHPVYQKTVQQLLEELIEREDYEKTVD